MTAQADKVTSKKYRSIGIFDSGLGGISVLREAAALLPGEEFLYFGDSLHAPYGVRSEEEVRFLTERGVLYLRERGCKAVVIACNTATAAAAAYLRDAYPDFPILGIEPAVKPGLAYGGKLLVMATPLTLREKKFRMLVEENGGEDRVISLPCPGIADLVEQGITKGPKVESLLRHLLSSVALELPKVRCIVLGCTHYPFVRETLKSLLPYPMAVIDGAAGTARELKRRLGAEGLLREDSNGGDSESIVHFENSDPDKLACCERLFRGDF